MRRRWLVHALLVLVCLVPVAGVAPARAQSASILQGTLRIAANGWVLSKFPVQDAANDFMAKHPGVKVVVSANDESTFAQKYLLDWSSGHTDVDLALGGTEGQLAPLAAKGLLAPWDDFFTGDLSKDKFIPAFANLGIFNGSQQILPFMGEVMLFSTNQDMFKRAELLDANGQPVPPKTWQDLLGYGEKLTAANGGKPGMSIHWGFSFAAYNYFTCLQGAQGTIYGADGTTVDFESANAHTCLDVGRQLIAKGWAMPGTTADDDAARTAFKAGQVGAILEAASREVEGAQTLGAEKVGLMYTPGTQQHGTIAYIHAAFIPKISPAIDLARAFVREEVLSKSFAQFGLTKFGKLPVLTADYAGLDDPSVKIMLDAASHAVNAPRYRDYNQLDTLMQQEIQKAVLGQESVDDALAHLHDGIRTLNLTNVATGK